MAGSRPDPTPKTTTSVSFTPRTAALLPITSPTLEAANGVPFFAPLKPKLPALDQNNVLPNLSARSTFVLLKVASTCKTPEVTFFFDVFDGVFFICPAKSFGRTFASFPVSSLFISAMIFVFHIFKLNYVMFYFPFSYLTPLSCGHYLGWFGNLFWCVVPEPAIFLYDEYLGSFLYLLIF